MTPRSQDSRPDDLLQETADQDVDGVPEPMRALIRALDCLGIENRDRR